MAKTSGWSTRENAQLYYRMLKMVSKVYLRNKKVLIIDVLVKYF